MKVLIFYGGEDIGSTTYATDIINWSQQQVEIAFINFHREGWATEDIWMAETPTKLISTINIVNPTIATAMTCGVDGGVTYMIRIEEET